MIKTIKLTNAHLADFAYEFSSSEFFEDGEGINDDFLNLYASASEKAYNKYKKFNSPQGILSKN